MLRQADVLAKKLICVENEIVKAIEKLCKGDCEDYLQDSFLEALNVFEKELFLKKED